MGTGMGTGMGSDKGMRILAAVAVVVSAVVHLYLWFDGVRDQGTVGQLFVVNVVAGAAIAVLLFAWQTSWVPPFLTVGFGASTLGAFLISTTVGLFGIEASWSWYAWLAAISEVAAMGAGAVLLLPWVAKWLSGRRGQHDSPVGGAHLH
jgi:hypothetical protein